MHYTIYTRRIPPKSADFHGYPIDGWFIMENPAKWMIWGLPLFQETARDASIYVDVWPSRITTTDIKSQSSHPATCCDQDTQSSRDRSWFQDYKSMPPCSWAYVATSGSPGTLRYSWLFIGDKTKRTSGIFREFPWHITRDTAVSGNWLCLKGMNRGTTSLFNSKQKKHPLIQIIGHVQPINYEICTNADNWLIYVCSAFYTYTSVYIYI